MKDSVSQERFARLLSLSALREAQIKANPVPFLNKSADEIARLRKAVESAIMTLSGVDDLDLAQETIPRLPPSIVETAVARNKKASDTLKAALRTSGALKP